MNAEIKILSSLDEFGKSSTSKVANMTGLDYVYAKKTLDKLKKSKKVSIEKMGRYNFWTITKIGEKDVKTKE